MSPEQQRRFLSVALAEPLPHQELEGGEDWSTFLLLGGRGSGKTFAGARWLAQMALTVPRMALVGPTLHDVREVMVEGASGLRATSGPAFRPRWESSRRRLVWPNGAAAYAFSAEDPDSLRGPQFHAAWADEFCAWPKAGETLAMLRFGLRLGEDPRLVVTTTPRPTRALKVLMAQPGVATTRAGTAANAGNLAPRFLATLEALYGGTRLAAQELDGIVVETDGGLFRAEDLASCRGAPPAKFDRVVVAVDPPATARGDACGVVVAGRRDGRAYVLADRTARGLSPNGWASLAVAAAVDFDADALVAEANQGGDMVRTVLAQAAPPCPIKLVRASVGKRARAEPVAALYEQGKVVHCGAFPALEEELMGLGDGDLGHSPDRADALVWALSELMLGGGRAPRLRVV
ncbi:DNA-packaging protein [Caulobacter radicis]|uniref:DNA-packaging protein n=1 Tax=Caulobacter radicis TaxID=2172650 RepID=UPI000D56C525|nr:terminase family protein [Caulobacter radicis]PVM92078.1 DNA-packaging protein [Caulobacter radicis]